MWLKKMIVPPASDFFLGGKYGTIKLEIVHETIPFFV